MQVMDHVVLHVIFSTKNQRPTLTDAIRAEAWARMTEDIGQSENILLTIGGTADAPTITDGMGNTAKVLCGNIPTSNATVFVIDKVLSAKAS